ncbi:unnamed protein product [Auanema sp. JU1783]|nr:unnamed protein product [Auanema sp. JU1783]
MPPTRSNPSPRPRQQRPFKNSYAWANMYSRPLKNKTKFQTNPKPSKSNENPKALKELFLERNIDLSNSKKLGSGKYSNVISAEFLPTKLPIAIKVIESQKITYDFRTKFLPREIECWKRLHHPNLVHILGHYETIECVFLAMEYGSRGDLLTYVQNHGPLPEYRARDWLLQILNGVAYMHSLKIVHRDLKLENIIIFSDSLIKISDFGFSKMVSNDYSRTYCGSKSYSAPEILLGQPYNPFKADVWSIGVIAYVMVTDCMPFNETLPNGSIINSQRKRDYKFDIHLGVSSDCMSCIDRMLTFHVNERPDVYKCLQLPWMCAVYRKSDFF